jgi:hypothetical protein
MSTSFKRGWHFGAEHWRPFAADGRRAYRLKHKLTIYAQRVRRDSVRRTRGCKEPSGSPFVACHRLAISVIP